MVDEELKRNVIKDVVLLKLVGFKPIIVHGRRQGDFPLGSARWGWSPGFVDGLRVTDEDTMEVAEMC